MTNEQKKQAIKDKVLESMKGKDHGDITGQEICALLTADDNMAEAAQRLIDAEPTEEMMKITIFLSPTWKVEMEVSSFLIRNILKVRATPGTTDLQVQMMYNHYCK